MPIDLLELKDAVKNLEQKKKTSKLSFYKPFGPDDIELDGSDSQLDFHKSPHRIRAVFGGNRSGKTECGGADACFYALGEDGEEYWHNMPDEAVEKYRNIETPNKGWVVSKSYEVQVDAAQEKILRLLPEKEIKHVSWRSKKDDQVGRIRLSNDSVIEFRSNDAGREAFQGAGKRWIWFDEEPDEGVYEECFFRQSGRYPLDIWLTLTPLKGITFVHDRIWKQRDKQDNIACFRWSVYDNPYLSEQVIKDLEEAAGPEDYDARFYGKFTQHQGLVYPMWDEDIHVVEPFEVPEDWDILEGIDIGWASPSAVVWMAVDPEERYWIIDELYQTKLTIPELCQQIHNIREEGRWTKKDHYEPRFSVIDPQANASSGKDRGRSDKQIMASADPKDGPRVITVDGSKNQQRRIRKMRARLKPTDDDDAGMKVFSDCENWIYEIENYYLKKYQSEKVRKRRNKREKPQDKDDHLMQATDYLVDKDPVYTGKGNMVHKRNRTAKFGPTKY